MALLQIHSMNMLIAFCMVANISGVNRICALHLFIPVVSPSSNASFVHQTDTTCQFGNKPRSSSISVLKSSQLAVWHSPSWSMIHFLYITYFAFLHFAWGTMLPGGTHIHASSYCNSYVYGWSRVLLCACNDCADTLWSSGTLCRHAS